MLRILFPPTGAAAGGVAPVNVHECSSNFWEFSGKIDEHMKVTYEYGEESHEYVEHKLLIFV